MIRKAILVLAAAVAIGAATWASTGDSGIQYGAVTGKPIYLKGKLLGDCAANCALVVW